MANPRLSIREQLIQKDLMCSVCGSLKTTFPLNEYSVVCNVCKKVHSFEYISTEYETRSGPDEIGKQGSLKRVNDFQDSDADLTGYSLGTMDSGAGTTDPILKRKQLLFARIEIWKTLCADFRNISRQWKTRVLRIVHMYLTETIEPLEQLLLDTSILALLLKNDIMDIDGISNYLQINEIYTNSGTSIRDYDTNKRIKYSEHGFKRNNAQYQDSNAKIIIELICETLRFHESRIRTSSDNDIEFDRCLASVLGTMKQKLHENKLLKFKS